MTILHKRLLEAFNQFEDHVAIEHKSGPRITYHQLNQKISGLIDQLKHTAHSDSLVIGILSTRCAESYIGVLAAFFIHVRFIPLNPSLPVSRLKKIINAGNINIVLFDSTHAQLAENLDIESLRICANLDIVGPARLSSNVDFEKDESNIAYQMFTSGSTGTPKGVPISYGSLCHYVTEIKSELNFPENLRHSQLFDLSFDLAMHDIFMTFSNGGTLVPASAMDLMLPHDYMQKNKIDIWFSVPMLSIVAIRGQANKDINHHLTLALFCGEALPSDYAMKFQKFLSNEGKLFNLYGPTEATIAFTTKLFEGHDTNFPTVPIGVGFGKNRIAIDTDKGIVHSLHEGLQGELLLSGPQVFEGYLPEISAECFIDFEQATYYRSGDNVEVISNQLLHKGRIDSQIKFRGYRIELGEIESTFRRVFSCSSTVAVLVGEGEKKEIALAYEHHVEIADFRALTDALPSYMLPSKYVRLNTVPTNINGKIDRIAIKKLLTLNQSN